MKKNIIGLLFTGLVIGVLTCAGCGNSNLQVGESVEETERASLNGGGRQLLDDMSKWELPESVCDKLYGSGVEISGGEPIVGQDDLIYFSSPKMAKTEAGYYYLQNEFLWFYDTEKAGSSKVCTKEACQHDDYQCDAYFLSSRFFFHPGLWVYGDKLYLIGADEDLTGAALWSVNLDGTDRHPVTRLFEYAGDYYGEREWINAASVHRGYLYYVVDWREEGTAIAVQRVKLADNAVPESIYTTQDYESAVVAIKGYGDGIFFQTAYVLDEKKDTWNYPIYYYARDGQCYQVVQAAQRGFNIIDNKLYYSGLNCVHIYNWETDEDEVFVKTDAYTDISYDSRYIYLDNYPGKLWDDRQDLENRTIRVFDYQGNEIVRWNMPGQQYGSCLFGDEKYLWIYGINSNSAQWAYPLWAIDKSTIESGESEWFRW